MKRMEPIVKSAHVSPVDCAVVNFFLRNAHRGALLLALAVGLLASRAGAHFGGYGGTLRPGTRQMVARAAGDKIELWYVVTKPVYETRTRDVEVEVNGQKETRTEPYAVVRYVSEACVRQEDPQEVKAFTVDRKPIQRGRLVKLLQEARPVLVCDFDDKVDGTYLKLVQSDAIVLILPRPKPAVVQMAPQQPAAPPPPPAAAAAPPAPVNPAPPTVLPPAASPAPARPVEKPVPPAPAPPPAPPAPSALVDAPVVEFPPLPTGSQPLAQLAICTADGGVRIRRIVSTSLEVTGYRNLGTDEAPQHAPATIRQSNRSETTQEFDAANVQGYTVAGEEIPADELAKRLAQETPVLVSADGRAVDPEYLKIIREDAVILVSPVQGPALPLGPPAIQSPGQPPQALAVPAVAPPSTVKSTIDGQDRQIEASAPTAPQPRPVPKLPESWVGEMVIPRPGVVLRVAGTNKPLAMKDAGELPWKISKVNGDYLWMGKTWIKKAEVQRVGDSERGQMLVQASESIRTEPRNAWHHFNRAFVRDPQDNENAIADLNEAIRLDPKNQMAIIARANRYEAVDKADQALADLNAAIKLNPNHYAIRATYYERAGKHTQALADFEKAIQANPGNYAGRAQYFVRAGDWGKALEDYDKVIESAPSDFNRLAERAWLLATCPDESIRNGEQALADAQAACKKQKWHNTVSALAAAYAETGDFDSAISAQEEAIELAKGSGPGLIPEFEQRRELYREKKPVRDDGKKREENM